MSRGKLLGLMCLWVPLTLNAADYPPMVGVWEGKVRTVSSGSSVEDQVARGGAVISEIDLKVTIDHQDGETFVGKSRPTGGTASAASIPVWGAFRSTGKEALFVTDGGGRGQLWMNGADEFEYCITNLAESVITAYCGILQRSD